MRDQPYPMGIFSEYVDHGLGSLIWQLKLLSEPNPNEQKVLDEAIASTARLRDIGAKILVRTPESEKIALVKETKKELENLLALKN